MQRGTRRHIFAGGDTTRRPPRLKAGGHFECANSFRFPLRDGITTVAFRAGRQNRVAEAIRFHPPAYGSSRRVALLNSRL